EKGLKDRQIEILEEDLFNSLKNEGKSFCFDGKDFFLKNSFFLKQRSSLTKNQTEEVFEKVLKIKDRVQVNRVFSKTTKRIEDLQKTKKNTNESIAKTASKVGKVSALVLLPLGLIALSIFVGILLTHFGIVPASQGIFGMPVSLQAVFGVGAGLFVLFKLSVYLMEKKGKEKIKACAEAVTEEYERKWFVPSNLNDILSTVLFISLAIAIMHGSGSSLFQQCLNYAAGLILLESQRVQAKETINDVKNSLKCKDPVMGTKAALNSIYIASMVVVGVLMVAGLTNSALCKFMNFAGGIPPVLVALYGLIVTSKKLHEKYKKLNQEGLKEDNLRRYLESSMSLTEEEIKKTREKITKMKLHDLQLWIEKNIQKDKKEKYLDLLKQARIAQEDKKIERDLKDQILNEEIKNKILKKIENFSFGMKKDTFEMSLDLLKGKKVNTKDLLAKLNKDMWTKFGAELIKTFALYIPFMAVPAMNMSNFKYDISMAGLSALDFVINLFPFLRNVSPVDEIEDFDINDLLNEKTKDQSSIAAKVKKYKTPVLA
ncbi:MAG: hypothetical protein JXA94_03965, partial [Parachlamydiales bacterium]|nr:hypothetical protein [Parachlamydiales bacterium]